MKRILEVHNLLFKRENWQMGPISFVLRKKEWMAVVGPNGSGKTTLLKLLIGALKPTRGTVKWYLESKNSLAYLPQEITVFEDLTVKEILQIAGFPEYGEKYLSLFKIDLKTPLYKLSGGQKRKVFIAQCFAQKPEVVVMDEPDIHLDEPSIKTTFEMLKNLNLTVIAALNSQKWTEFFKKIIELPVY